MTYQELKDKHRKALEAFPMSFAFSNQQLKEGLEKLGATKDEVVGIGNGGFIRKTDVKAYAALIIEFNTDEQECFANDEHLKEAIRYELGNHEFGYTYDPEPTLDCLGLSLDDERTARIFEEARAQYLEENKDNF